ncbi:MAG: HD domain-containing protein [Candidatus ainarchaeum sp.]|jgi:3'-5' exoribonuclease|nr:HD domain-containing protein [Candidatus ainarchaeum sp.]
MIEKKIFIKDLKEGLLFEDYFVVKFKKPVIDYAKGFRFEIRVGDKTGEIMLKFWGGSDKNKVQKIYDSISIDDVILVNNIKVNNYNDQLELSINDSSNIQKIIDFDLESMIPKTDKDIEELKKRFSELIESVTDQEYKKILQEAFTEKIKEKFFISPAAMYLHHGYIGGLLEHTINVCNVCLDYLEKTEKRLDRDLLITGALLHDYGKMYEFMVTSNIKITNQGQLIGHITIGATEISKIMDSLNISENKKNKIINIILSHHGKKEYGSPKEPATPEAMLVFIADFLDATIKRVCDIKENANTEDFFIYNKEFGNIYLE